MKKIILYTIFLMSFLTIKSETPIKSIYGKVIDKNTKESLVGVKIEVGNQITYTDLNGDFSINNISDSVEFSLISYKSEKIEINKDNITINLSQID